MNIEKLASYLKGGEKEFVCLNCGNCCVMEGHVFVSSKDISATAEYLNLSRKEFIGQYVIKEGNRTRLNGNYEDPCIFLEDNKCKIYPVRPNQCSTFPYWLENLTYMEYLSDVCEYCKGLQKLGTE